MNTGKLYEGIWREFSTEEEKFRIEYKRFRLEDFFKLCKLFGIRTILDAGCGSGISCVLAKEQGFIPTGFDLNISVAREKTKEINLMRGNLESLPFANNFFDACISMNVVHHTDEKKTVPELKRVTKKIIFFSVYGKLPFFKNYFEKAVRLVCKFIPYSLMVGVLRLFPVHAFYRSLILDNGYVLKVKRYSEKDVLSLFGNGFFCIFRRYGNLVSCIAIRKVWFLKQDTTIYFNYK